MGTLSESQKPIVIPSDRQNYTLQVVLNQVLLSRTQDQERLFTNLVGLLTSLLSDQDLAHRLIGGNLLVQLADGWVLDGVGTLKHLEIGLILNFDGGEFKNLPASLKKSL